MRFGCEIAPFRQNRGDIHISITPRERTQQVGPGPSPGTVVRDEKVALWRIESSQTLRACENFDSICDVYDPKSCK